MLAEQKMCARVRTTRGKMRVKDGLFHKNLIIFVRRHYHCCAIVDAVIVTLLPL